MARRVLGIDPGSRKTGFGVVEADGAGMRCVVSGAIALDPERPMAERLAVLHDAVTGLLRDHVISSAVVERVFVSRNADSALKLGHARGVVLLALQQAAVPIVEYTPAAIKKAITGNGRAEKYQVGAMVRAILGVGGELSEDAADALAIAVCGVMIGGERDVIASAMAGCR